MIIYKNVTDTKRSKLIIYRAACPQKKSSGRKLIGLIYPPPIDVFAFASHGGENWMLKGSAGWLTISFID